MLLAVLLLSTAVAVQQCNETTFQKFYFDLCLADAQCNYNFVLEPDEFPFFSYLMESEMMAPRNLTWEQICESENAAVLWLSDLRVQPLCLPTQQRDPVLGCIMRSDRSEIQVHLLMATNTLLTLIQLGFMLIFIYISLKLFKEIRARQELPRIKLS